MPSGARLAGSIAIVAICCRAFQQHGSKPEQYSYYHDFLDKLFWTLATAPGSAARLSGIPFLNGGLFDDDEFLQTPNRKTNPPLKVCNKTMQYVFGELLEAFNFTVTEGHSSQSGSRR